jgi:hypothetical protein
VQHPVLVLELHSGRTIEVHVPVRSTPTTLAEVEAVLQAAPYNYQPAEQLLVHPDMVHPAAGCPFPQMGANAIDRAELLLNPTTTTTTPSIPTTTTPSIPAPSGCGLTASPTSPQGVAQLTVPVPLAAIKGRAATGAVPLLLLAGGPNVTFGVALCDALPAVGMRSKYPSPPCDGGADFDMIRGSSLDLGTNTDFDFGPECCGYLAETTGLTVKAAELLRTGYIRTVDVVRKVLIRLTDARAGARIAEMSTASLRAAARFSQVFDIYVCSRIPSLPCYAGCEVRCG